MFKLSLIIGLIFLTIQVTAQSPHGKNFKVDCASCHTPASWTIDRQQMTFNHDSTNYHLTGQHLQVNCKACHPTLVFADAKNDCAECHSDVHQNSLGKECSRCHTTESFIIKNISPIHEISRFPLLGAHKAVDCASCHISESDFRFTALGVDCYDCHQKDYQGTTNPNHLLGGFSTTCTDCHGANSISWNTSVIDHSFFPLTGGHAIECTQCHTSGQFGKISNQCNSCHTTDYNSAQLPNHTAAGIPKDCETCHNTAAWKPSTFNHLTTGFELKGGHKAVVQCSDCHHGNLTSASSACVSCHQAQYDIAPKHKQFGYPTDCALCHNSNNWLETTFDHSKTHFPLTGAHTSVDCAQCHSSGFAGTSTLCFSCHSTDYNNTKNPNHAAAKFPTECESCHKTTSWTPATFNHDSQYFPIYSGKHRGAWSLCTECHTNSSNYSTFSCINCHEHSNKTSVDRDHKGMSGYSYTSTACYSCHPKGRAD